MEAKTRNFCIMPMTSHKAKILTVIVAAVLMLSLAGTFVLADEDNAGLDTGSASQVSADSTESTNVFLDTVKMKTTFNKQKKAEIALRIADKRALKAGLLAEKGKREKAKEIVEKHKEAMENAEEALDDIATNGDEKEVKAALRATVRMQVKLEAHKEKYTSVHSRILERQSDKMDDDKLAHLEEVFSKIGERWAAAEDRIAQKQENLIARYKVLTGATDDEISQMLEDFRTEFQSEIADRKSKIQANEDLIKQKESEIRERIKEKGLRDKPELADDSKMDDNALGDAANANANVQVLN